MLMATQSGQLFIESIHLVYFILKINKKSTWNILASCFQISASDYSQYKGPSKTDNLIESRARCFCCQDHSVSSALTSSCDTSYETHLEKSIPQSARRLKFCKRYTSATFWRLVGENQQKELCNKMMHPPIFIFSDLINALSNDFVSFIPIKFLLLFLNFKNVA